jgi:hypothetical protein
MWLVQRGGQNIQRRYRLRLPVIFHWNDGVDHTEGGFTNDVAADGASIVSSRCPPSGTSIRIEVLVPSPCQESEELRIESTGTVERADVDSGCFYVHCVFDENNLTRHGVYGRPLSA